LKIGPLIDTLAEAFPDAQADRSDGLRLDWPEGWVHLRASNTEPIVRVIAESSTLETAHELANRVVKHLKAAPA
jgi:phosphomannomutase